MSFPSLRCLSVLTALAAVLALQEVQASPFLVATEASSAFYSRDVKPGKDYQSDPNTISSCSFWYDNDGSLACDVLPPGFGITLEQFVAWNPSLTSACGNFRKGWSYCVEISQIDVPNPPVSPSPTKGPTTATTPPATTTRPGNGVETPELVQPGMVQNCDKFHPVEAGQSCSAIADKYRITVAQLIEWSNLNAGCSNAWAGYNVCVHTIGLVATTASPTTTTTKKQPATTTKPGNGIETPELVQPGMVKNCDKFHAVESGQSCVAQLIQWNNLNAGCSNAWAGYSVCVHTIGLASTTTKKPAPTTTKKPPASTTTTGNGIKTPSPLQPGVVNNCDKFHVVKSGQTCAKIAANYGITVARLVSWNKSLTTKCTELWLDANVCVHTIGYKATTKPTCATSGASWGSNKAAALKSVTEWCDGQDKSDGSGGYATAQTKKGCFNAPDGKNKIELWARDDFGIGAKLTAALCEQIVKVPVNSCAKGGTAVHEGWWVKALLTSESIAS
ncbi:uncharacterized protein B0I36DRAFT_345046 [Microdochium trichocladiopsis]|uniref:LysM domain-containing protein n=1 Tax=Microdochium trichocladiopsis TaxID=1682393 RepID=A0A9P9C0T7_9PEZI|nr:uncharacterized protein B0I36DRAFT_345046 [Microdochium trichocladiopsis]KAH7041444.1 hypothetical protein B0I36DRAFT_345046 [Microdochium trichocladiopsis]